MRAVGLDDLRMAARALLAVPPDARQPLCSALLEHADEADCHVRELGKRHPEWGDGTLRSAAMREVLEQERWLGDPDYRACCQLVLSMLGDYTR